MITAHLDWNYKATTFIDEKNTSQVSPQALVALLRSMAQGEDDLLNVGCLPVVGKNGGGNNN